VENAKAFITKSLDGRIKKGKLSEEGKEKILKNIKTVSDLSDARDVDLAEEAVFEDINVKQDVFRKLDEVLQPNAILGSNTSALPATPLASVTKRPDKFMVIHFHQPPTVMKLVELVKAMQTSDETAATVLEFCRTLRKDPVLINVDCPGFLTNRTMIPLLNEVIYCIYEGVSTKEDIDLAFKGGFNWPMGPVQLCDFIGLDVLLHIMEDLHKRRGGDKFLPCPLLSNMVDAGYLGHKNGKGFYDYSK
jgi:3-hydroxybutyryl-CoA dehydrogenase